MFVPPNVVTPVPPLATVSVPDERIPDAFVCTAPAPNPARTMFPVDGEPKVNVCLLVVAIVPLPERVNALAPLFAEIEAVGVPPATPVKANLAEDEVLPPINRSSVGRLGYNKPRASF